MSAPTHCRSCGYTYINPEKPDPCLCPPDEQTEREIESSAAYAGGQIGRNGSSYQTTDYGRGEQ